MFTLSIEEVPLRLPQIIDELAAHEELVITRENRAIARLIAVELPKGVPIYGRGKGKICLNAEDTGHLDHFRAYMP